jgi:hypothetical protein
MRLPGMLAAMKLVIAVLGLLAVAAQAELKWDTSRKQVTYDGSTKILRTEFAFTNKGKATARITSVKSGCKCCTSAKTAKLVFAPGERGAVAVRVDVSGKQLPMVKPVVVGTDDGSYVTLLVDVTTPDGASRLVPKWGK